MSESMASGSVWDQAERTAAAQERISDSLQSIAASLAAILPILQAREERDPLRLMDEVIRAAKEEQESGMPDIHDAATYERVKANKPRPAEESADLDLSSILGALPIEMRAQFLAADEGEK